jgi:hypothetical protein
MSPSASPAGMQVQPTTASHALLIPAANVAQLCHLSPFRVAPLKGFNSPLQLLTIVSRPMPTGPALSQRVDWAKRAERQKHQPCVLSLFHASCEGLAHQPSSRSRSERESGVPRWREHEPRQSDGSCHAQRPQIAGWVCPHPQEQAVVAVQGVQLPSALTGTCMDSSHQKLRLL